MWCAARSLGPPSERMGEVGMRLEAWTSPNGKRRVLTRLDAGERWSYDVAVALAFPDIRLGPAVFGSPARTTSLAVQRRRWRSAGRARGARPRGGGGAGGAARPPARRAAAG